ncbi:MAG TPA: hypothetical protein VGO52_24615 [Hyphomonadaceae bacterium]|jgi:hypothetical protein|nr:hypothetical protein [Hyphomonadaceae bacterium]
MSKPNPPVAPEAAPPDPHSLDGRSLPRLSERKSFRKAEEKAREILRERGFSEAQIEIELRRVKRRQLDE